MASSPLCHELTMIKALYLGIPYSSFWIYKTVLFADLWVTTLPWVEHRRPPPAHWAPISPRRPWSVRCRVSSPRRLKRKQRSRRRSGMLDPRLPSLKWSLFPFVGWRRCPFNKSSVPENCSASPPVPRPLNKNNINSQSCQPLEGLVIDLRLLRQPQIKIKHV